jgi:hypothetical protein
MDLFAYINRNSRYSSIIHNDRCIESECEAKLRIRKGYIKIKADEIKRKPGTKMCDFIIFIRKPHKRFSIPEIELKSGILGKDDIDPILDKFENGVKLIKEIIDGCDTQLDQCDIIKQLFVNMNEIDSPSAYRTWTRRYEIRLKRCGDMVDVS